MFTTFAHQITSSAMSIGQMNSPYSRPWLWPGQQPDDPEQVHQVPGPGARDAEPLAPHPAGADQAREHVEERAEVHHRQPREDHAVHVRRADPAELSHEIPPKASGRDELGREHEAEEVDDRQPDDRREEPVLARRRQGRASAPRARVGQRRRGAGGACRRACGRSPAIRSPIARDDRKRRGRCRGKMTQLSSAASSSGHRSR